MKWSTSHALIGSWSDVLYLSHVVLEIFLGLIKLRGRYQHESPGARGGKSAMYVRHHAFSILSMTVLSYLIWHHGLVNSAIGKQSSAALAMFHGGAVGSFSIAWSGGAIPFRKIIFPHLPHALGFATHALL